MDPPQIFEFLLYGIFLKIQLLLDDIQYTDLILAPKNKICANQLSVLQQEEVLHDVDEIKTKTQTDLSFSPDRPRAYDGDELDQLFSSCQ